MNLQRLSCLNNSAKDWFPSVKIELCDGIFCPNFQILLVNNFLQIFFFSFFKSKSWLKYHLTKTQRSPYSYIFCLYDCTGPWRTRIDLGHLTNLLSCRHCSCPECVCVCVCRCVCDSLVQTDVILTRLLQYTLHVISKCVMGTLRYRCDIYCLMLSCSYFCIQYNLLQNGVNQHLNVYMHRAAADCKWVCTCSCLKLL